MNSNGIFFRAAQTAALLLLAGASGQRAAANDWLLDGYSWDDPGWPDDSTPPEIDGATADSDDIPVPPSDATPAPPDDSGGGSADDTTTSPSSGTTDPTPPADAPDDPIPSASAPGSSSSSDPVSLDLTPPAPTPPPSDPPPVSPSPPSSPPAASTVASPAAPAVEVARIRFNAVGQDDRAVTAPTGVGSSLLWTDPAGLSASPWPSYQAPQPAPAPAAVLAPPTPVAGP